MHTTSGKTLRTAAMLATSLVPIHGAPPAEAGPWPVKPAISAREQLFPQGAVRLLDGPFLAMQELDHAYLIRLEP
ncbi:MAG: hypothetical protein WCS43_16500, partial [Verrucomicrobiota bacterium]